MNFHGVTLQEPLTILNKLKFNQLQQFQFILQTFLGSDRKVGIRFHRVSVATYYYYCCLAFFFCLNVCWQKYKNTKKNL